MDIDDVDDDDERTEEEGLTRTHYAKLHCVYRHLFVMLGARGHQDLPNADMAALDLPQFIEHCERRVAEEKEKSDEQDETEAKKKDFDVFTLLRLEFPEIGNKTGHVLVWFMRTQTRDVPISDVQEMIEYMLSDKGKNRFRHVIIVSNRKLGFKSLDELRNYDFEHFSYEELDEDITKHRLVPRHVLASAEDIADLTGIGVIFYPPLPRHRPHRQVVWLPAGPVRQDIPHGTGQCHLLSPRRQGSTVPQQKEKNLSFIFFLFFFVQKPKITICPDEPVTATFPYGRTAMSLAAPKLKCQ